MSIGETGGVDTQSGIALQEPQAGRSFRENMVDVLEHTYGPVFLSALFSYFLAMSDASHEVILAFADDVLTVMSNWLLTLFLALFVVGGGYGAYRLILAKEIKNVWWRRFAAGVVVSVVIFSLLIFTSHPEDNLFYPSTAQAQQDFRIGLAVLAESALQEIGSAKRLFFSLTVFFFVPISLYEATRLGLYARRRVNNAPPPLNEQAFREFKLQKPEVLVLGLTGRLPLLGAAIGLIQVAWGEEGTQAQDIVCWLLAALCFAAATLRVVFKTANTGIVDFGIRSLPFGLGVVVSYVFIGSYFRLAAELAGPIAIVSTFVILAAGALSWLTYGSARMISMGKPPLIVALVVLVVAMSGPGSAYAAAVIVAAAAVTTGFLDRWTARLAISLAVFAVLLGGLGYIQSTGHKNCNSLAGCNIMTGTEVEVDPDALGLRSVGAAFDAWRDRNPQIDVPVVVAAQGGGLFAGYHAAYDMAQRQDNSFGADIRFADRIFAISGVSGGSFGSAVFWAIRQSRVCEDVQPENANCYTEAVQSILARDYLSAPVHRMLYLDNFDSLVPWSVFRDTPVDRGNLLTERVNDAVNHWLHRNGKTDPEDLDLLKTGLRSSWQAEGVGPLLFLNTTDLQTGDRVVQSPVDCFIAGCPIATHDPRLGAQSARVIIANADEQPRDLTVGEAAVLSARFPIVTPPGRYRECADATCSNPVQKQIADGGYFDNTGLETVSDILSGIAQARPDVAVEVLSYSILTPEMANPNDTRKIRGTFGAPIHGVSAATTARRGITVERFCALWVRNPRASELTVSATLAQMDLTDEGSTHNFTLSWLMGRGSFDKIADEVRDALARQDPPLCNGGP